MARAPKPGSPARGTASGRPIMVLLDLLGRRWAMRMIWELHRKPLTFRDLQAACGGISPTILNTRLAELRDAEIVAQDGTGYTLTAEGQRLLKELLGLHEWAERWAKRKT